MKRILVIYNKGISILKNVNGQLRKKRNVLSLCEKI